MIEVNLHPYGKKGKSKGGGFNIGHLLDRFRGGAAAGMPDPYILFAVIAGVLSVAYVLFMFFGVRRSLEDVQVRVTEELDAYERFQDVIERNTQLLARRDSIAERVAIIQDIDAGRYVGAHVMDEVALALPDYTWLTEILWVQDNPTQFRLTGRAGTAFQVTDFLGRLEASRFLRDVEFEGMNQAPSPVNPDDIVYVFTFLFTYEPPSLEDLETVPLFGSQAAQVADTTGGS